MKRQQWHHFHDENGNYGITTFFWDKIFAPIMSAPSARIKPDCIQSRLHAGNCQLYPKVAELSGGSRTGPPTPARTPTRLILQKGYRNGE